MRSSMMINYIRQNVDMGISGLEKVIPHAKSPSFRSALESQLREYQQLSLSANRLLGQNGGEEVNAPVVSRVTSEIVTAVKSLTYSSDSEIAEDMIRGTTTGITKLRRHLTEYGNKPDEVCELSNRVIAFEENNIEEMKKYL